MSDTTVLLLGPEAQRLAARLEISGYTPSGEDGGSTPRVVLLSPGEEHRIPALRACWPGVPLLLGLDDDSISGRSHCLTSGADDYWLTTRGASDLLTRLRLHLETGRLQPPVPAEPFAAEPPAPDPPLQVADLAVNPQRRQVRRGRRLVPLTAREYQLLLLLIRQAGTVVTRERILSEIWNDQPTAMSNVIEVYVRYLRQKLEEEGERRLIHTVRGQGYCLSDGPPSRVKES